MSLFEDAMSIAVQLPQAERERLAQALGVASQSTPQPTAPLNALPLSQFVPRPNPAAWRKAETGHAVLRTESSVPASMPGGLSDDQIPVGAPAIAGMWESRTDVPRAVVPLGDWPLAATLPARHPVVVHTDVCIDLALGRAAARRFFEAPPVEVRLATAGYLALLAEAANAEQQRRIRRFVQPYAVLSLGPMASSRAVELVLAHALADGLTPLDALIAATALAHEIPLVACDPRPFQRIAGLTVCLPYPPDAA